MKPSDTAKLLADAAERERVALRIRGGRRCAIRKDEWLNDWWIAYSPRNGDNADVEGSWADWVELANAILHRDAEIGSTP